MPISLPPHPAHPIPPIEPPIKPPRPTPCQRAQQIYDKAIEEYLSILGRSRDNSGIQEYESGTRRVAYVDPDKARRTLDFSIDLARRLCPDGDFPGGPAAEEARYGIITDV